MRPIEWCHAMTLSNCWPGFQGCSVFRSQNTSKAVQDRAIVTTKVTLPRSHIQSIEWHHFQWPEWSNCLGFGSQYILMMNSTEWCILYCPTADRFLPARRYASAGNSDRNVSVRPSVCLSVTRRYCVKTKKASGMISSPSGSPKTLVFW